MFSTREGSEVPNMSKGFIMPASLTFSLPKAVNFRPMRHGVFASMSSSSFGKPAQEPHTGIPFPSECCVLTSSHCPKLAGAGVRAKRVLGVKSINVYALGLYVDAAAAKRALHKYRSQPESELVSEQKLYDDLVSADSFEKTLRLVISYGSLKRAQFVNALEERLAPPLTQAGASAVLKDFQSLFDDVNFKKGTEITFTTQGKNKLVTKVDGQQKAVIDSPVLVRSLFDIYLGTDPVSEDAKLSFGKGLAALIKE